MSGLPYGATEINAQQFALIGGGAVRIAEQNSFFRRGIAGVPQELIVKPPAL
jgi:hypothetical protein